MVLPEHQSSVLYSYIHVGIYTLWKIIFETFISPYWFMTCFQSGLGKYIFGKAYMESQRKTERITLIPLIEEVEL